MLEFCFEMGLTAAFLHFHIQAGQRRNGKPQGFIHTLEPCFPRLFGSIPYLPDNVASIWIIFHRNRGKTLRIADNLRKDMPVLHTPEEFRQLPEFPIGADLLQSGLHQPLPIAFILLIRTLQDGVSLQPYNFFFYTWHVLDMRQLQFILPYLV